MIDGTGETGDFGPTEPEGNYSAPWNEFREQVLSVVVGSGITTVEAGAFAGCSALTDVWYVGTEAERSGINVMSGNTALTDATWHYCKGTTGETVTWTFDPFTGVLTVSGTGAMPDYPAEYTDGHGVFPAPWSEYADEVVSVVIEDGVTAIGSYAFQRCTSLTELTVPGTVKNIDDLAFEYCTALKTLILEDGVETVGGGAFRGCSALTDVTLYSTLQSIGDAAFAATDSVLSDVWFHGTAAEWAVISIGDSNEPLTGATIHYICDNHNYVPSVKTPETCTEPGEMLYPCTKCGDTYTEPIPADHDYVDHEAKAPTCLDAGRSAYQTCSRCDYTTYAEIPALGHIDENTDYICDRCETLLNKPNSDISGYGTVITEPENPKPGETVVVVPQPVDGCDAESVTVTDSEGHVIPVTENDDGTWSFVQPENGAVIMEISFSGCPAIGYTDIAGEDHWSHKGIDYCVAWGYMGSTRTDALTFEPATKVTRAMVASILYRMADSPEVSYTGVFKDVKDGKWYTAAVEWCAQNGLAAGKGNGKFDPNGNVTRQELAVFMMKMSEYRGNDVSGRGDPSGFADADTVLAWAVTAVRWAVDAGIISGREVDGVLYLAPADNAVRSELASILMRFLG